MTSGKPGTKPEPIPAGIKLSALNRLWLDAGGLIETIDRTGENRYVWKDGRRSNKYRRTRKDAPKKLVMFVNQSLGACAPGAR